MGHDRVLCLALSLSHVMEINRQVQFSYSQDAFLSQVLGPNELSFTVHRQSEGFLSYLSSTFQRLWEQFPQTRTSQLNLTVVKSSPGLEILSQAWRGLHRHWPVSVKWWESEVLRPDRQGGQQLPFLASPAMQSAGQSSLKLWVHVSLL